MTPRQQETLALIRQLNGAEFDGWFRPSEIMAFCQIESSFRARSYRGEPHLGEGSYGLMQVLASTAREIAGITDPESMYDPATGLRVGMSVAFSYWAQLQTRLDREPSYEEWSDSYNRGVGGVLRDLGAVDDHAYPAMWDKAQEFWASKGTDG